MGKRKGHEEGDEKKQMKKIKKDAKRDRDHMIADCRDEGTEGMWYVCIVHVI